MLKLIMLFAPVAVVTAPAIAASPFDGTWTVDLHATQVSMKPETLLLKDGSFGCSTCTPPYTVKADGQFHPVLTDGYRDAMKVEVIDPHTVIQTYALGGKQMGRNTSKISADGATLSYAFERTNTASGASYSGSGSGTRVGPAPAGAHAMSGSWQFGGANQMTENATTIMLKVDGDMVTMSSPTGESYTARVGGPPVLETGDAAHTMITVARPAADTIVERDSRDGKVADVFTMTLLPDGKTMKMVDEDKKNDATTTMIAHRQ